MILRLTEGSLSPVACADEDGDLYCDQADNCITFDIWKQIRDAIDQVVDNITLQDLMQKQLAKEKKGV
jgi:DNA-binding IscR family transcriptional regulator